MTTIEAAGGRTRRIRAQYVIGADGPRSFVRTAVGIEVDELGRLGDFMAVTFRADLTRRLQGRPGAVNTVEIEGAEGVFVPTGAGDRWVYAREWFPGAQPVEDWSTTRCIELIRAASGVPELEPEIMSVMPFVMGGHVARAFGSGRVLLVGDAAHRTTPVGGTGMNTAIHAAHNLGWKLAWVLRGWAGESLLNTYEAERRPIGTQNVVRSLQRGPAGPGDGAGADGQGGDAAGPGGPAGLNGLSWDVGVRYPTVGGDADADPVGARAPHAWVRHQGRRISAVDLFDGRDPPALVTNPGVRGTRADRVRIRVTANRRIADAHIPGEPVQAGGTAGTGGIAALTMEHGTIAGTSPRSARTSTSRDRPPLRLVGVHSDSPAPSAQDPGQLLHPRLCAAWSGRLMPVPPTGVVRCAASPTGGAPPAANARGT